MSIVVSCASDNELANKLFQYLAESLPEGSISIEEDEITISKKELSLNNDAIRKILGEFVASNSDLVGYSITEFGDVFTIGIVQRLDQVVLSCEMCGYLARDENLLNIHKKTHGLVFMP